MTLFVTDGAAAVGIGDSKSWIYLGEDGNMDDKKKAKLILSPKENAARYGDLIESEEFSIEETNHEE